MVARTPAFRLDRRYEAVGDAIELVRLLQIDGMYDENKSQIAPRISIPYNRDTYAFADRLDLD
jgi:hypothetical protein